jgi:hypothetical protein
MAVVPGALRRVARNGPRLIAVALLGLVCLAAAGINVTAADRLHSLLDENWRGAYDILVTAEGSEVAGLLAPNSLAAGVETMRLEDLERIRAVAGIEVAAPIGEVIIPAFYSTLEMISLPMGVAGANDVPQAFRVTITRHTDDGLGGRLVSQDVVDIVLDETEHPEPVREPCNVNGFDVDPEKYPILSENCWMVPRPLMVTYKSGGGWGGSSEIVDGNLLFNLGNTIRPSTRVTLVDPSAEHELLGEAGGFLAPLEALSADGTASEETINAWSQAAGDEFAHAFARQRDALHGLQGDFLGYLEEMKRLFEENGTTFESPSFEQQFVPLIVRKTAPAPLSVTMNVEAFGAASAVLSSESFPFQLPPEMKAGVPGTALGSVTVDASAMLNPFSDRQIRIPWPGTAGEVGEGLVPPYGMSIYELGTAQAAEFTVASDDVDGVVVDLRSGGYIAPATPWGFNPYSAAPLQDDGSAAGMESAFVSELKLRGVSADVGFAAVPVGGFSLDGVADLQSGLGHVPLGAYGAVGSTLVPGSSDAASGAVELRPSVSGLGLVSPDTVAIASIGSVVAMGQDAPINAVRIRVAGVDRFSAAGMAKIATVADELRGLGFTATIVAGSSPTDVTVHVDDYAFGVSDPGEEQRIGYLGAVTQRWSELGAAARADLAVSASSLGVLAVALGSSALLLGSVQLASVPGRRTQASVMRTIGWPRRRLRQWMAAEELVSFAVVAFAGLVALVVSHWRPTVGLVVGASLAALVVTSVLAVSLGSRPTSMGMRPTLLGKILHRESGLDAWVTSLLRFSVRQLSVHRAGAVVQLLATVVVAVSAAAVTATALEGRAAAGASALGDSASNQALIPQVGLGLVALTAGIILAFIARRIGLDRRREQWVAMRAMGFGAGQLRAVQLTEGLLVGVPAVATAAAAGWLFVGQIATELREVILPVAAGAAVAITVILMLTSWREKR